MKKLNRILALIFAMVLFLSATGMEAYADKEDKTIVYGTSADYPPFEFIILDENGEQQYVGIDVFLAEKIAKDMGKELRVVNMSFDNLLAALQKGEVDFVIAGMEKTPEREKAASFSDPYYTDLPPMVLVKKDKASQYTSLESFKGKTVGAQTGTTKAEIVTNDMKGATLLGLSGVTELVNNLEYDKCDAIILDGAVALQYEVANDNMVVADVSLGEAYPYRVAVEKGDPKGLLTSINKTVNNAVDTGLIDEWIKTADELSDKEIKPEDVSDGESDKDEMSKTSMFNFSFLPKYGNMFVKGLLYTLLLSVSAVLLAVIPAFLLACLRLSKNKIVKFISGLYIDIFRSTPLMVQLSIIYFGVFSFIKIPSYYVFDFVNLSMFVPGVIALALNSAAYIAEIFRAGILAVDAGQTEAARSLGLSQSATMIKVVLPQAVKNVLPALANELITMVKESSICSTFGMMDLMWAAKTVASTTYITLGPYVVVALVYFCINYPASKAIEAVERRMRRGDKR